MAAQAAADVERARVEVERKTQEAKVQDMHTDMCIDTCVRMRMGMCAEMCVCAWWTRVSTCL